MEITREELIRWIKENDLFYYGTNLAGHDHETLVKIYYEIQEKNKKEQFKNPRNDAPITAF